MGPSRGTEVYQRCWRRRISASRSATVGESRDGQPRRYDGLEPAVEWVGLGASARAESIRVCAAGWRARRRALRAIFLSTRGELAEGKAA
jgi:hypothetical protein